MLFAGQPGIKAEGQPEQEALRAAASSVVFKLQSSIVGSWAARSSEGHSDRLREEVHLSSTLCSASYPTRYTAPQK